MNSVQFRIRPEILAYEIYEDDVLVWPVKEAKEEPLPELPAEVHHTEPFDADRAWRATLIACKGER